MWLPWSYMNMTTKNTIFSRYLSEYLKADSKRKGEILDHVSDVTTMHRKSVIRKFLKLQRNGGVVFEKRGRKIYYTSDVVVALKSIWFAASGVCGELVYPVITEYVAILKRDGLWEHSMEVTEKLLQMSEATVKRRVASFMLSKQARKGISTTNPSQIKEIIPIFTGPWRDKPPGFGQIEPIYNLSE